MCKLERISKSSRRIILCFERWTVPWHDPWSIQWVKVQWRQMHNRKTRCNVLHYLYILVSFTVSFIIANANASHIMSTLRYYLRTKAAADAIKFTVEVGGSLTKVVASKTCWSFFECLDFFFLKASFYFMVCEAWGSEVPHFSGDLYEILCARCKNWRLKRQQSRWVA